MSNRLALFDIDGTLIEMWEVHKAVYAATIKELYGVPNVNFLEHYTPGESAKNIVRENLSALGRPKDFIDAHVEKVPDAMAKNYGKHINSKMITVIPGVIGLLSALQASRIPCGVVSGNGPEVANAILKAADLSQYFQFVVTTGDSESREERFAIAIGKAGLANKVAYKPGEVFYFDDSDSSIPISRKVGIKSIAVALDNGVVPYKKMKAAKPDYIIRSLTDAPGILSILTS